MLGAPNDPWSSAGGRAQAVIGPQPPPGSGFVTGPWRVDVSRAQAISKLDDKAEAEPQLYKIWKGEVIRMLALDRPELEEALMWQKNRTRRSIR